MVGIVLAASAALIVSRLGRAVVSSPILLLFAGAFAAALFVLFADIVQGAAVLDDVYAIDKPFKLVAVSLVLSVAARDAVCRERMLRAYVSGWWLFIAISLIQIAVGHSEVAVQYGAERVSVLGMNLNAQALTAASGIVLLFARALRSGTLRNFIFLGAGVSAGGFVFLIANSRTGIAALVAGVAVVIFAEWRARKGAGQSRATLVLSVGATVVLTAGMVAWGVQQSSMFEVALSAVESRATAAIEGVDRGDRDNLSEKTLDIIARNPGGIGYGRSIAELGSDPHNDFLKLAAEGGWVAALLLVAGVAVLLRKCLVLTRVPSEAGALGGLAVYFTMSLAGQGLVSTEFWFFLAMVSTAPRPSVPQARGGVSHRRPSVLRHRNGSGPGTVAAYRPRGVAQPTPASSRSHKAWPGTGRLRHECHPGSHE